MKDKFDGKYRAGARVRSWGTYLFLGDWRHERVLSRATRIEDPGKVPQPLCDMAADVDLEDAIFLDWVTANDALKGYLVVVEKSDFAKMEVIVDLRFRLVDLRVWFPKSTDHAQYGYTNGFLPGLNPKEVLDAFWGGRDENDIVSRLDVVLEGRLEYDSPVLSRWGVTGL
jgi:hypothetical protein